MLLAGDLLKPLGSTTASVLRVVSVDGDVVTYAPKNYVNAPHMHKSAPVSLVLAKVESGDIAIVPYGPVCLGSK